MDGILNSCYKDRTSIKSKLNAMQNRMLYRDILTQYIYILYIHRDVRKYENTKPSC